MDQTIEKYFSLALSVDCVVFGFDGDKIKVLLIERNAEPFNGCWALPGDLVHPEKDLKESVNAVLYGLTGLSNLYFEQVETFGEGIRILFSLLNFFSLPPEKKKVTCGYFSVSAILI